MNYLDMYSNNGKHKLSYYLRNNKFDKLIEEFFDFIEINEIDLYNEECLKFELGTYLRMCYPKEYNIDYERNVREFNISNKTSKSEIDITIYNDKEQYAIELKFPSFKKINNKKVYNGGNNDEYKHLIEDIEFIRELKNEGFTNAWSFTVVDEIAEKIYTHQGRNESELYKAFRHFDKDKNPDIERNPYNIDWKDWKSKKSSGKYYIVN